MKIYCHYGVTITSDVIIIVVTSISYCYCCFIYFLRVSIVINGLLPKSKNPGCKVANYFTSFITYPVLGMFFTNEIGFHMMFFQVDISLTAITFFNLIITIYNIKNILSYMYTSENIYIRISRRIIYVLDLGFEV